MDMFSFAPDLSENAVLLYLDSFLQRPASRDGFCAGVLLGLEMQGKGQGERQPEELFLAFANRGALDLFAVATLEDLRNRFFRPRDPALCRLVESLDKAGSCLTRMRFFVAGRSILLVLWCRLIDHDGRRLLVLADAQAYRPRPLPVPDVPADSSGPLSDSSTEAQTGNGDELAVVAADLASRFPAPRPLRFLWITDPERRLVTLGRQISDVTGIDADAWQGQDFVAVIATFDPEGAKALTAELAGESTFQNVKLAWPIAGRPAAVRVSLGGTARRDSAGRFMGFSGFGLVHKDQLFHRSLGEQTSGSSPELHSLQVQAAETLNVEEQNRASAQAGADAFTSLPAVDALHDNSRASASPLRDDGNARREATLRKALETRMHVYENEARELHAILDTATDGVAVLDGEGIILSLNRSGEALFGYDRGEVEGQPLAMLIAPESRDCAIDYFNGLKTGGVFSLLNDGREIFGLARQGGRIPLFMTLGRIGLFGTVDSGEALPASEKYCVLLRDMSHWKKVEQELDAARLEAERANTAKSDFLAKISHEIRTPLNAILGFTEVIMDERFGPIGNERYKDYLKDIHMSGALVMSLVNDLLDLSKIEAGKLDLDFAAVDTNQILTECIAIMQPQANRERILLRLSLAPALPPVLADERSLRQIILNLLSNAVKFTAPGGQVVVTTALAEGTRTLIRIRDTGSGMSEEDIGIAMQPFRQLPSAKSSLGTGLGLPLTKALVEANNASFSLTSRKNEGTVVEILFPPAKALA